MKRENDSTQENASKSISESEKIQVELTNPITGEVFNSNKLSELFNQFSDVKKTISESYAFLKFLNRKIMEHIPLPLPDDKKTIYLECGDNHRFKVELRTKIKWDQRLLNRAMILLGDRFFEICKTEYTPYARKLKPFMESISDDADINSAKDAFKNAKVEDITDPYIKHEIIGGEK